MLAGCMLAGTVAVLPAPTNVINPAVLCPLGAHLPLFYDFMHMRAKNSTATHTAKTLNQTKQRRLTHSCCVVIIYDLILPDARNDCRVEC